MRIYIMRHGEAENFAASDAERPLTERGSRQSKQMAEMLAQQLNQPLDTVLVSTYLRAQQTWQCMESVLPGVANVQVSDEITPYGDAATVVDYLKAMIGVEKPQSVLLVSHLPLVGYLTSELVAGIQPPMFSTSAIAAIDYDPDMDNAELVWQNVPQ
ncbi:phosphohistidine phosphatase SixA [Photobacterium angustum]|uniref:Phosphohistidine phosphatase SixA n=1 Tax=Photobacterium angustum TaxID=661 RepID=A0A855SFK8_PHOAN|nr:phosphohistidine phosphatase SixA [Photobacterium angustum]KJF82828.1 phosphohistidine phosphatase [Photobacterium damselae subsp. damselae]KJG34769.1 phosphohistidine phosphatase [Photobacterium angustum]KJG42178.1 phosphohistidine phosphatase [Photobacterium angustum]KJG46966.1 phosphohistidine phosphatase [Photobacterium angustum]KJG50929.1 phosphohistidine phosphatase [Photobacterium angustum]